MENYGFHGINLNKIPSPCFVVDLELLENNLKKLAHIQEQTGVDILLALKGFSMYHTFDLVKKYLKGVCASGLHEAMLGDEYFSGSVHTYSPAFSQADFDQVKKISSHISFNSLNQWNKYKNQTDQVSCGLRVNPQYSEVAVELYNPCAPCSRLGLQKKDLEGVNLGGIKGLHFHALCEQNADTFVRVLENFERLFGKYLEQMQWVNFGGGHHITREDYKTDLLIATLQSFKNRHPHLKIFLEPGEAIALNTGILITTVLDVIENDMHIAILNTSAECHMPDVLAMPYRPEIVDAAEPNQKKYTYRLGGMTCLAGDVIGDYSFDKPLLEGDQLIFLDMGHYSMVKTTTFNGINLPSIATYDSRSRDFKIFKTFGYEDFKSRL